MKRTIAIGIAAVTPVMIALLTQTPTYTQGPKPPELATDIYASDVQAVLNAPSAIADRLITAVDMGTYNVGVGVLRRGPTKPGAPVGAINHDHITEVYYIISGTGTLVTGGTVTNPRRVAADNEIVTTVVGPSSQGTFDKPAQRRKVGPGDVVIIPPGVYHGFDEVPAGGIDYLAVRPDPTKVLPAGYVHPAIKALKK
jgi:mannose-6-phosphate isomerase-like protein (cupin superfamily)